MIGHDEMKRDDDAEERKIDPSMQSFPMTVDFLRLGKTQLRLYICQCTNNMYQYEKLDNG